MNDWIDEILNRFLLNDKEWHSLSKEFHAAFTAELALNQAAIVREAAAHQPMLAINDTTRKVWVYCSCGFNQNADSYEIDPRVWTKHILAIPTDQPALARHDAEIHQSYQSGEAWTRHEAAMIDKLDDRVRQAKLEEHEIMCDVCDKGLDAEVPIEERCSHGRTLYFAAHNRAAASPVSHQAGAAELCPSCKHSLKNNLHGLDQNDIEMDENGEAHHVGSCTYCSVCNPQAGAPEHRKEQP